MCPPRPPPPFARPAECSDKSTIGVVLSATDRTLPQKNDTHGRAIDSRDEEGEGDEDAEPVKVLEETASFDEVVVWGHEAVPESDDPYVRGVEEWVAFAEAVGLGCCWGGCSG